jgi:hypothetical protein
VTLSLAEVEAALEEKLPGHTFRAVMSLANSKEPGERETRLRDALENRERDEAWTAEQKSKR